MAERSDGSWILLTIRLLLISLSCLGLYCSAALDPDHSCQQDGFFGRLCRFQCNCKDGASCDKTTGSCPMKECAGDFWGDHCLLSSSCSYHDAKSCDISGAGGMCTGLAYLGKRSQSVNGECRLWKNHGNYPESDFRHLDGTRSDAKNYCRNLKIDAYKPWCYTTYRGGWEYCSVGSCDCPKYRYGQNCESECLCYDVDEVCDGKSGVCPRSGQCWQGVNGTDCKTSCQDGRFGINCEYTCHCRAGTVCNKMTGKCPNECDYGWSGEACQIGNGALGKNAEQSSTYVQYNPYIRFDASRAVDNDTDPNLTNGHCSHTTMMDKPWWRVDLGFPHVLFNLTLYNRDCSQCAGANTPEIRLKEIKIWMTDGKTEDPAAEDLCYFLRGSIPDSGSQMIQCTKPVIGRFLFIQLQYDKAILDFCEVKIHAYQYKACPYLEHGPNCNLKCQCKDASEKCDIITGRCPVSGCNDLYTGENCQIELPSMNIPPTQLNKARNSITVAWPDWQEGIDNGMGPVTTYKLQYTNTGILSWRDVGIFSSDNKQTTVTGLDLFTFYDFRMILGWQGNSTTGVIFGPEPGTGAVGTYRTSCIEPSLGPSITSHQGHIEDMSVWPSTIAVELKWDAITSSDLNCESLKEYIVYMYYSKDKSTEWLQNSTKATTFKLTGLVANMGYEVIVGVVNEEGYQTNGTVTAIKTTEGRPGNVSSLQVEKLPNSELRVTWQKSQESYGTIRGYYIQWQQVAYGQCKNVTRPGTIRRLSDSTFSYKLEWIDVCPFCRYKIKVFAETNGGNGTEAEMQESTSPGVPLRRPDVYLQTLTSRSIAISWQEYPCEDRNGPNGAYSIQIHNLADNERRTLDPIPLGAGLQKVVTGLIPYTRYYLVFMFVNSEGASPNVTMNFQTREEVPPPPRLEKLAVTPDSITVGWYPPDPPLGKILEFQLRYWEETDYNETKNLLTIPNGAEGSKMFGQLTTNVRYAFMIQAKTSIGWGNWSEKLVVLTEEDWPGIPKYLKMSEKSTESFKLTWTAPSRPSVDLIGCQITCEPVFSYDQNITANAQKHRKEYVLDEWVTTRLVSGLNQATQYNCSVQARGNKGYGEAASDLFWTRPKLEMTDEKFVQIKTHQTTDHTITINIPPAHSFAAPISFFLVGVEDKTNQRQKRIAIIEGATNLTDYHTAKQRGLHQYLAAELDKDYSGPFIIGDGKTYGKYTNPQLETGHKYNVIFGVVSDLDGEKVMKFARTSDQVTVIKYEAASGSPVVYIVVAVVLVILVVFLALGAAFFIRQRRLKYMCKSESLTDVKKMGPEEMTVINGVTNPAVIVVPQGTESRASCEDLIRQTRLDDSDGNVYENVPANRSDPKSHAILLDDILSYVAAMKKDDYKGFKEEYQEFKPEMEHPHDESKKEENKGKNRFKNIVAYDHSRVILDVGDNDSNTDYINANYIDGYKKKKAYIAAQGPTKAAINDIWRAVWQERCPKIVMLTNCVEMGKQKCERYWPESGSKEYGEITVEVVTEEQFADMTVTALRISKDGQERRLKHFHFTVWPDHGAPKFASSMLHFWREVTGYSGEQYGPVYVHCSAGVGRTGTFIGLDYLIQQGSVEKMVNVYECVRQMRLSRPKMVQTWEQYVFLHDALVEHFRVGLTAFPSSMFCDRYGSMVIPKKKGAKSRLQQQFKLLSLFTSEVQMKNCANGLSEQNIHKNRSKDIIPEDRCRPYLTLPVEGCNSYINAVFIDGYNKRDRYIVSQMPLTHTVIDLWRLVHDHKVTSIVMLNQCDASDQDSIYWQSSDHKLDNEAFSVQNLKEDTSDPDITTRDFKFVRKSKLQMSDQMLERSVRQFQFNSWPDGKVMPSSAMSVVSLVDSVERWQQQSGDGKILVHCMDGAAKSGIFCVAYSVIEKNKVEHDVDVFQYTRLTRTNRPQLVSSYEQYQFIHDIVAEYLKQFDIYANFQ